MSTVGPITQGWDSNFFQKVTISNSAFANQADILFNIKFLEGFMLNNETNSSVLEYSFNGTTLHGEMDAAKDSKSLKFDHRRVTAIWFRVKSGGPITVRVEAWASS